MVRILAALVTVLLALGASVAKEKKEYTLTLNVHETKVSTAVLPSNRVSTDCDDYTGQIHCDSRQAGPVTVHTAVQIAEGSDGNTYELKCVQRGFLAGFAEGAAVASGGPTEVYRGCMLKPGTYQARPDKAGFKVVLHDVKGKEHEITFIIMGVRRTDAPSSKPE